MRGGLTLIITIAIITFIIEAISKACIRDNLEVATLSLFHHLIYTYALLGWLLDDFAALVIYISIPALALLHWNTTAGCIVSDVVGSICGNGDEFKHLGRQLGVHHTVICILVGLGVLYAIYKLYRILRYRPRGPAPGLIPCR